MSENIARMRLHRVLSSAWASSAGAGSGASARRISWVRMTYWILAVFSFRLSVRDSGGAEASISRRLLSSPVWLVHSSSMSPSITSRASRTDWVLPVLAAALRRAAETPLRDCRVPSSRLGPLDWSRSRADLTAALKPVRASAAPSTTAAVSVTACWSAGS